MVPVYVFKESEGRFRLFPDENYLMPPTYLTDAELNRVGVKLLSGLKRELSKVSGGCSQ